MFRALRHRNFRLFFVGQSVSLIGTWMQFVAQGWLVWELTHSPLWLGFIGFMGALPVLLLSFVGGAVADRVPKRPLIIGLQGILLVLSLALGLLTLWGKIELWQVGVFAFLLGLVNAFDMPARQAFLIELVEREDLGNAIALNAAIFNSARFIGPALASLLLGELGNEMTGIGACFLVNSASFLAAMGALSWMNLPPAIRVAGHPPILQSTLEGLRYIRGAPPVFAQLALVGTITIFGWSYSVLIPVFAAQILHAKADGYAGLLSCSGLGAVTAALTLAAWSGRFSSRNLSFAGVAIFCASAVALAFSSVFWISAACMALTGFGLVMFFASSITMLQTEVPDAMRGRVMGIYAFVFNGFFPIASLQAGLVADRAGAPFAVIFGAAVCALAALGVGWLGPGLRSRQATAR